MQRFIKYHCIIACILFACYAKAQNYNPVLNYSLHGTPANGVKIKTNLPFVNFSQMPTITIEGFNYNTGETINLSIVWYIYDGKFWSYGASTSGGYAPEIKLSNENGNVVIFINDRQYYQRFTVRAFAQGMAEVPDWFQGWTAVDEPLTGSNTVTLPYKNNFAGNVGIGTGTPSSRLTIDAPEGEASTAGTTQNGILRLQAAQNIGWGEVLDFGMHIGVKGPPSYAWIQPTNKDNLSITYNLVLNPNSGNVGIGTTTPTEKLCVDGNIKTRKVIVTQTNWPDYVFDSSYKLPSLNYVSDYIKENKRLPEMASATEVEKNGCDLGDIVKQQQKKIEELMLYMIEMKKENNFLKQRIEKIEKTTN